MLQSIEKRKTDPALEMIEGLRSRGITPLDQALEVWGPDEACQYDTTGAVVIQMYRTLVVRRSDGRWYFVRNVREPSGRRASNGVDYVSEIPESEARQWLLGRPHCRKRSLPGSHG